MRLLVTGVSGLVGSNLAAAAAQQSWDVLGTWHTTPVCLPGVRTTALDMADRHACVALAEHFEPDVLVHAAASVELSRLERDPQLARLNRLGTEHTLAAARSVRAHYVLVSSDWIFSGRRPPGQCWDEHDTAEPINAYGHSKLACERVVQDWSGSWLITRPANVYGVNLSIPAVSSDSTASNGAEGYITHAAAEVSRLTLARHIWERSSLALRWVSQLRGGRPLPAPIDVHQSPTYAWDYAQRVCELIGQECEGIYNTAGPEVLSRYAYLRLLAGAFDCDPALVHTAGAAAFLRACGEDLGLQLPFNTALCDAQASFVLGRPAISPLAGHRQMREQLRRVLVAGWASKQSIKEIHR